MICLSSAGSLAPFDGGGSTAAGDPTQEEGPPATAPRALRPRTGARGSEADTRSPKGSPVVSRRGRRGGHSHQRPLALRGDTTSTPMGPLEAHLEANPRNARTALTPHARPEHAPHSPTSASGAQHEGAPEAGSGCMRARTEVGWELHSKEHTSKRNLEMPCAFKVSMIH